MACPALCPPGRGGAVSPVQSCMIGKIRSRLVSQERVSIVSQASRKVQYFEASAFSPGQSTADLNFYTHSLCPYAQRVWCALEEKGLDYNLIQVDLSSKPGWFNQINPSGLVPAVEYCGNVVTESSDICKWINDEFEGPDLMPDDKDLRNSVEAIFKKAAGICGSGMQLMGGSTSYSWKIGSSPSASQINSFESNLELLRDCLAQSGGPFLGGDNVTLADIVIFPFMERFALAMPVFSSYDFRSNSDNAINKWLGSMEDRDSMKTTMADRNLLLKAFREHRSLDFFDYSTYNLYSLHPHLK